MSGGILCKNIELESPPHPRLPACRFLTFECISYLPNQTAAQVQRHESFSMCHRLAFLPPHHSRTPLTCGGSNVKVATGHIDCELLVLATYSIPNSRRLSCCRDPNLSGMVAFIFEPASDPAASVSDKVPSTETRSHRQLPRPFSKPVD